MPRIKAKAKAKDSTVRSDLSPKAVKPKSPSKSAKAKQRSAEYLKYKHYIASKEFKVVRDACFARDNYRCACCGWSPEEKDPSLKSTMRNLTCHHKSYVHLYHELDHLDDVVTLCNVCHCAIHRSPSNFKRFRKPE